MLRVISRSKFCVAQQPVVIQTLKSRIAGSSTDPLYDKYRSYYNNTIDQLGEMKGITVVKNKEMALKAIEVLYQYKNRPHAWDTETCDLDLKNESPYKHGKIICCSCFCGPEVNFGNGPRLFIDNFAQNSDLILLFKDYLQDPSILKIWHNYSFDRQMFFNHNVEVQGFAADTMHMARLQDPSKMPKMYSLSNLSEAFQNEIQSLKVQLISFLERQQMNPEEKQSMALFKQHFMKVSTKQTLNKLFGTFKKLKTGKESQVKVYPSIVQMHTLPQYMHQWINYSTLDAEVTYFLYLLLNDLLSKTFVRTDGQKNRFGMRTLLDIYHHYWRQFGELLTSMERNGFLVDIEHMKQIEIQASSEMKILEANFLKWVQSTQEDDMSQFNISSASQLQQLFFAPCKKQKKRVTSDQIENLQNEEENIDEDPGYFSDGRKKPVRKEVEELLEIKEFKIENTSGIIKDNRKIPLKFTTMKIKGLGIKPQVFTASGLPSTDTAALKILSSGEKEKNIIAKLPPEKQASAKEALKSLLEHRSTETLLTTFIKPLIQLVDKDNRIHTSLNINTETGRISSRNPNLLNQPALDKDRFKIRKAFRASPGKKLIVADYGQLELRVLAHMTACKTMIDAFLKGGDFHSRTAITMYPYIDQAIQAKKVLLEWDKSKGIAPAPLVKDIYGVERKKAKTMNFSIAYGKTASGFAKEWNCSVDEAQKTIDAWFSQRLEVVRMNFKINLYRKNAQTEFYTRTLIGRTRSTSKYFKRVKIDGEMKKDAYYMHGLRAAINTPIQGGAADIVIASMVKLSKNNQLKELGWKLLLQIHDELILVLKRKQYFQEGPEESSEQALAIVKNTMEHPFDVELMLALEVDAKVGDNWYECK